jgi:polar amino acid transport system substrate-binding protein
LKRFFVTALTIVIVAIFLTGCKGQASPNTPRIRIGVDPKLPPFEELTSNGKDYIGFDIDLMQAIAEKGGFEFEFSNAGNSLVPLVSQCQLDAGISALPMMAQYLNQVDFSAPYYTAGWVIVVKQGNISISGQEQLPGQTVGVQTGSIAEKLAQQIPGIQLKSYATLEMTFQNLIDGYLDAALADRPRAVSYVDVRRNTLKIVGDELGGVDYGIATCKTRTDLLAQINAGLARVKADGTLDRLVQKWGIPRSK